MCKVQTINLGSPGNLLGIHILGPHPRPMESAPTMAMHLPGESDGPEETDLYEK